MTQPVKAAIVSFTEIDTGWHRAYNQWHRFDHMPEEFVVNGVVAGERFVATPDLLARRDAVDEALAATQYFGFYLVSQPVQKTFDAIEDLWSSRPESRGMRHQPFERRGPSAAYRLLQMYSAPDVVSAPAVMPFRPHQGVFVTVDDPKPEARRQDLARGYARHEATRVPAMLDLPGVAGCWSFEATSSVGLPGFSPAPARRAIRVYWLDGDPGAVVEAVAALSPDAHPDGPDAYSTVFSGGHRFIAPDSTYDWFDAH